MKVQQISEGLFVLQNAVLELTPVRDQSFGVGSVWQAQSDHLPHVRWGAGDDEPNWINKLIEKNNQVRGQLEALRDIIYGTGVGFFKREMLKDGLFNSLINKSVQKALRIIKDQMI